MKIIAFRGNEDIARVFAGKFDDKIIEFVESRQPPLSWDEKWVIIVSVSFGCPIKCKFCDAGGNFAGHLTARQMFEQVDYLIAQRYPNRTIPVPKLKIQFARMGEPALNSAVIDAMKIIRENIYAPGLMFCISTVAPVSARCDNFLKQIAEIKGEMNGKFQLQFSVHSTDENQRNELIPIKKWQIPDIAKFGKKFWHPNDRKITLNFAVSKNTELNADKIVQHFDPNLFLIKITPINPTESANANNIESAFTFTIDSKTEKFIDSLRKNKFDVIISRGEFEENFIGSNCGQFVNKIQKLDNSNKICERDYGTRYRLMHIS